MAKPNFNAMSQSDRRKVSEDTERSMRGLRPIHGIDMGDDAPPDADTDAGSASGTGTEGSGYMPPEAGPFRCDNCTHFHGGAQAGDDDAPGMCDEPHVVSDPEVKGRVQAGGCCSWINPLSGSGANAGGASTGALSPNSAPTGGLGL